MNYKLWYSYIMLCVEQINFVRFQQKDVNTVIHPMYFVFFLLFSTDLCLINLVCCFWSQFMLSPSANDTVSLVKSNNPARIWYIRLCRLIFILLLLFDECFVLIAFWTWCLYYYHSHSHSHSDLLIGFVLFCCVCVRVRC